MTERPEAASAGSWQTISLGDAAKITSGPAFQSSRFTENADDVPLLRGTNVGVGATNWSSTKRWPRSEYGKYERYALEAGDVILAMDRPWITEGLKLLVLDETDLPALLVQRVARIRASRNVDQRFLSGVLRSESFAEYLKAVTTGTAVPHISGGDIADFRFLLPPFDYQRRIGCLVRALDELIEINERRIEVLEDLARSLYREWFVRFRFPGHADVELVDYELGPIPEGWAAKSAAEIFAINPRIKAAQSTFRKVTMGDVSQRVSVVSPSETATKATGTKFHRDDVLLARITPCLENGKTALVKFLEPGEVGIGSTEFIVLRGAVVGPAFTYCAARSDRLREHAIKSMSGASGRQRVSTDALKDLVIVEPPRALADRFETLAGPMLDEVFALYESNRALANTRDLLLPRLVTGQLDISDIDLGVLTPPEAA